MFSAHYYRQLASELRAKALTAPTDATAADFDNLARAYLRLADQAEHNRFADIWAEFGAKPRLEGEGA